MIACEMREQALPGFGPVRLVLAILALTANAVIATNAVAPATEGFSIGVLGPHTIWDHGTPAGAVAFDLDFRKHFDLALQARLGPPVIDIPEVHPGLKGLKIQLGTTHGSTSVGLRTAIDWFQGTGGSDQVVGIVGAVFSSISMPVASLGAVFKVPQVSYGSTNPALSDKQSYPYFARVVGPDAFRAQAIWSWKVHFKVPSLAILVLQDLYGLGFAEALRAAAQEAGALDSIITVGMDNTVADNFDFEEAKQIWSRVFATGTKFCLIVANLLGEMLYVLEQEGMLYDGTLQIILPDQSTGFGALLPTRGNALGTHAITEISTGPKFPAFKEHWTRLTPNDLYGDEARHRYKLDAMKMPFNAQDPNAVTNATFTDDFFAVGYWGIPVWLFDAAYSLTIAINNLLLADVQPEAIRGELLLKELLRVDFPGVSGRIRFDENGDIRSEFGLFVAPAEGAPFEQMGMISPSTGEVTLANPEAGVLWASGTMNVTAPTKLLSCDAGYQFNTLLGRCSLCPDGFKSSGGELPKCEACPAGSTSNSDATACVDCGKGWANELSGGSCSRCSPGKFSDEAGSSSCKDCPVGRFNEQPGATACILCGEGLASQASYTTMTSLAVGDSIEYLFVSGASSRTFCACGRGTRNSSSGECSPCGEGLVCFGMGSVQVEEGFYAAEDLSVFRCYGDKDRCPGGPPGDCCAEGRTALGCSECENGMTPKSDGSCAPCGGSDKVPFAFALLLIFACLVIAYYLLDNHNRATQSHALLICTFAISQFLTTIQQMGVIGMLSIEWKDPIKSFLEGLSLLILNLEVLRLGCVGEVKPLLIYLVKVFAIFGVLLVVSLIHCVAVVVLHKGRFSKRLPVLVAAFGTIFMVSYIAVTSAVMEPLQCLSHPNGKWTIREYPSIICWETGEHTTMLVLGTIMFVIVPVGFIVGTIYIVRDFPKRLREADSRAVKAFSFLFFRFRPGCHTYVVAFVLRSFFVALVLVVPDLLLQVFLLLTILMCGFAVILLWLPWRVQIANFLEVVLTCTTILLIALSVAFIPEEDKEADTIADVGMVCIILGLALVPCIAAYGLWRRFFRVFKPYQFFLCHYKVGSGAWTRLLKFHLLDSRKVKTNVFIDSDNLDHLDHLFDYVGNDTGTLVVVGTQGIFQRPWCLGEMCTALLKSVPTLLLSLPTFELPEDSFMTDLKTKVHNVDMLIECGMTLETLQNTLQWITSVPRIVVPPVVTVPLMDAVAGALCSKTDQAVTAIEARQSKAESGKVVNSAIVCDHSDSEALATACILQRIVTTFLTDEPESIPSVVDHDVAPGFQMTLVICMNLAFTKLSFLELLVRCTSPRLLPIIAESSFQIPGTRFAEQLQANLPKNTEDLQSSIVVLVTALFKKIGANFEAGSASETVLQASAADIAKQVKGWGMVNVNSEVNTRAKSHVSGCSSPKNELSEIGDDRRNRFSNVSVATANSSSSATQPSQQADMLIIGPRHTDPIKEMEVLKELVTVKAAGAHDGSTYKGTWLADL